MLEQAFQVLLGSRGVLRLPFNVLHPSGLQETGVAWICNLIQNEMLLGSLPNRFCVLLLPDVPLIASVLPGRGHLPGAFFGFCQINALDPADGAENLLWLGRAPPLRDVSRRINPELHPVGFDASLGNADTHRQTIDGFVIFLVLSFRIADPKICKLPSAGDVSSTDYRHATQMPPEF